METEFCIVGNKHFLPCCWFTSTPDWIGVKLGTKEGAKDVDGSEKRLGNEIIIYFEKTKKVAY